MKPAPVILALIGFGTALVQTLDAMDARRHEAEVVERESEVVNTMARVVEIQAQARECPC